MQDSIRRSVEEVVVVESKKHFAIVVSHTPLGSGFCTNILVPYTDGTFCQFRPRTPLNNTLSYETFGYTAEQMIREWIPGRIVEVTGARLRFLSGYQRITHPEDSYFQSISLTDKLMSRKKLRTLIDPIVHNSITDLFPTVQLRGYTYSASVPSTHALSASVGYVRVHYIRRGSEGNVFLTDAAGNSWKSKQKGIHIVGDVHDGRPFISLGDPIDADDMVVRVALSSPFGDNNYCWVMVSDIFW